jgi:hypothetical protein
MSSNPKGRAEPGRPMAFQIRIKGHLGDDWTDWFAGMTITLEQNGDTLLTGPVPDQAALYGLLRRVRDLGMQLISVNCIDTGKQDRPTGRS